MSNDSIAADAQDLAGVEPKTTDPLELSHATTYFQGRAISRLFLTW